MERAVRILVVDDEDALRSLVRGYLEREGFDVVEAADGPSAVREARALAPDVVVLDLMLPGIDGYEVCRQIRSFADPYIVMLTARTDEVDRVIGLTVGADDYLGKPFSPRELVARVKAMLRRPRSAGATAATSPDEAESTQPLRHHDLLVDLRRRSVRLGDRELELTPTEYGLLTTLMRQPGVVLNRQQLLDAVWGADFFGDEHVVDVHLGNLRRKLGEDAGRPRHVETIRGVGYRFRER